MEMAENKKPEAVYAEAEKFDPAEDRRTKVRIELVLLFDVTAPMLQPGSDKQPLIETAKKQALLLPEIIQERVTHWNWKVVKFPIRLILFGDPRSVNRGGIRETDFVDYVSERETVQQAISAIQARPEDVWPPAGLDALSRAYDSPWDTENEYRHPCRLIFLWTANGTFRMQTDGSGSLSADLKKLEEKHKSTLAKYGYLCLLAPDLGPWRVMTGNWDWIMMYPSKAGDGLPERTMIDMINPLAPDF